MVGSSSPSAKAYTSAPGTARPLMLRPRSSATAKSSSVSQVRLTKADRSASLIVRRWVRKRNPCARSSKQKPRPTTGSASRHVRPCVARGGLQLAQLVHRVVAPRTERFEIFVVLGSHFALRALGPLLPLRGLGVPLIELILQLANVFVTLRHGSLPLSWLCDSTP